jgi:hypothetical protein
VDEYMKAWFFLAGVMLAFLWSVPSWGGAALIFFPVGVLGSFFFRTHQRWGCIGLAAGSLAVILLMEL